MKISDTRLINFRNIVQKNGMRLTEVAARLNKAPAQVSAFAGKNPTKGIGDQIAREIERAFGLSMGYLDIPHQVREDRNNFDANLVTRALPVLGYASAFVWCLHHEKFERSMVQGWVHAPEQVSDGAFVLRVEGISMLPKFSEGDRVVIEPTLEPEHGNFVAAFKHGEKSVTLKQLTKEAEEIYLFSLNKDWPNRIIKATNDWVILGSARWLISDL